MARNRQFGLSIVVWGSLFVGANVACGQGVIELPDLFLGPPSTLPVQLGGTAAGEESDLYLVETTAQLEGRLDLIFVNGYVPQPEEFINIITAESIESDFRSHFFLEPLPPGVAVNLLRNSQNYGLRFESVGDIVDFVAPGQFNDWNNPQIWSNFEVPTTLNEVVIQNTTGDTAQVINVFGGPSDERFPTRAHSIELVGDPSAAVIVDIFQGGALSASERINVSDFAAVTLRNGSLVSNVVTIRNNAIVTMLDSEIISGNASTVVEGRLLGNGKVEGTLRVVGSGEVEVGPDSQGNAGLLEVVGDYLQSSGAELQMDVSGVGPLSRDRLAVTGTANLEGKLSVDLSGFTNFGSAGAVEIIQAGFIDDTSRFDAVEATGIVQQGVYAAATYTPTTVALNSFFVGDMNRDGFRDAADVEFFALALRDRGAYENYMLPDGSKIGISGDITGDLDFDGDLDFEDIDDLIGVLPASVAAYAESVLLGSPVPEPSAHWLVAVAMLLLGGRLRR